MSRFGRTKVYSDAELKERRKVQARESWRKMHWANQMSDEQLEKALCRYFYSIACDPDPVKHRSPIVDLIDLRLE